MNNSPQSYDGPALTPEERRQQDILAMSTTPVAIRRSAGERLLPYLFMATETCWITIALVGLASTPLSPSHALLLPFWAPFVYMAGTYWLATRLEVQAVSRAARQGKQVVSVTTAGETRVYLFFVLSTLLVAWASMYRSVFVLDPRWLLTLCEDILSLNLAAFHFVVIVLLALFFCWRGARLSRRQIEPAVVISTFRIGVGVTLALVFIQALVGGGMGALTSLLWLSPIFLSLALLTHALARAVFLRRTHATGLLSNTGRQERALLGLIAPLALLLLLLALLVGAFASPAFLAQVQQALSPLGRLYDGLVYLLSELLILLATPIFWLFSLLHPHSPIPHLTPPGNAPAASKTHYIQSTPLITIITPYVAVIMPILLIVLLLMLIRLALRRRRLSLQKREEDTHESLWSWQLFWTQLKALLLALLHRLFPRHQNEVAGVTTYEEISKEPAVRTIREIYRAFLTWCAARGYPRRRTETPFEFSQRLAVPFANAEPEIAAVTETYTEVRYGDIVPDETEVAHVRSLWQALQQKSLPPHPPR
jgi:hypothetical protein